MSSPYTILDTNLFKGIYVLDAVDFITVFTHMFDPTAMPINKE